MGITFERFMLSQPTYPEVKSTDRYYFELCNKLIEITETSGLLRDYHPSVAQRSMLVLVGYYQDMICDAGLWHTFIDENRRLYGKPLPFYTVTDDYIDYELNREDVAFMIWYATCMYSDKHRYTSPDDSNLMQLSDILFRHLEEVYDISPIPEDYCFGRELEMHDPLDRETIMDLGHWLFLHSWLLTPAYAVTLADIIADPKLNSEDTAELQKRINDSMNSDCTGPLALTLHEWTYLTVAGKMPPEHRKKTDDSTAEHKHYTAFTRATGGSETAFFKNYDALNTFLIEGMGWTKNVRHLETLADSEYITLMANRKKGLLVAPETARCIASPANPYYDSEYASENSFRFLSERGRCPAALAEYCLNNGWLRDARFPGTDNRKLAIDNADFIMRCYLQNYYRAD